MAGFMFGTALKPSEEDFINSIQAQEWGEDALFVFYQEQLKVLAQSWRKFISNHPDSEIKRRKRSVKGLT